MAIRSNGGPIGDDAGGSLSALIGAAYDDADDPQLGANSPPEQEEEEGENADDVQSTDGENADHLAQAGEGTQETEDGAKAPAAEAGKAKAPSTPALTAPKHWPKARADAFAKLPTPEAKKALLDIARDLEGGFTRRSQELADKVRFADEINGLFADHHRAQMAQTRTTPIQALDYLVRLQDFSARQPREYLRWAMQTLQQHPLDVFPELAELIQRQGAATPPAHPAGGARAQSGAKDGSGTAPAGTPDELAELFQDPRVKTLEAEIAAIKQGLGGIQGHLSTREQQQRQWQESQRQSHLQMLDRHVQEFRSSLDDAGQLKYPHFDSLRQQMGALMDTHPALRQMADGPEKLAGAYDMALRADPSLYQAIEDARVAAKVAEATRAQEAARAKRAAAIRPKTQIPSRTATKGRALEALISDAIDQQGGLA